MSSSCSFRITRTAEDLAQTINSLSQRLVKLEQRLQRVEMQFKQLDQETSAEEIKMLDGVDQILRECQDLLDLSITSNESSNETSNESWKTIEDEENIAA